MKRKVRIEIDPSFEEEIVIRCKELTPELVRLQALAENGFAGASSEMALHIGNREFFIALGDILFFETGGTEIAAHTADHMYYTDKTLRELSEKLPGTFMRVSKSCIVNVSKISSLCRDVTGCEANFFGCDKKVYVSRMYYKPFREKLLELRLKD